MNSKSTPSSGDKSPKIAIITGAGTGTGAALARRLAALGCLILLAPLILAGKSNAQSASTEHRFEKNVRAYETADKVSPPPQGAILLAGDSQFFRWQTLQEDLPGYTLINRGIDGFRLSDLVYFTDRLVLPYMPRLIILHVGGNDVHNGSSAEDVLAEFKVFVARVRMAMPAVPIAFSSITPGPGRWEEAALRRKTNQVIRDYVATQNNLHFIDLWDAMLTPEGQPREDLWVEDRVHPNHAGYQLRVKIMRPLLGEPDRKSP